RGIGDALSRSFGVDSQIVQEGGITTGAVTPRLDGPTPGSNHARAPTVDEQTLHGAPRPGSGGFCRVDGPGPGRAWPYAGRKRGQPIELSRSDGACHQPAGASPANGY